MGKYCFGIDVGGTSVKCGLFQTDGVLVEKWEIPTRKENSGEAILPDIAKTILDKIAERKLDKEEIDGVGIGVPGPVNERGEVPCAVNLFCRLANATGQYVVAVEYRLAPEDKFPVGLEDCYAVAKTLYSGDFMLNIKPENITLIGDSAGGNLCAALSLMARDCGEFMPKRQILIYPATYNDYTENSPFPSVKENGTDYLLTAGKMQDYIDLYARNKEDKKNPYFAPYIAEDLANQPDTLILTCEFDPLRDEGEAYGKRLKEAGNYVEIHRIKDALHGYFALGIKQLHVQESFTYINEFLKEETL